MSLEKIVLIAGAAVLGLTTLTVIIIRMPKRLKADKFSARWKDLQCHCRDKENWPKALTEADKLLDRALKKRKFKGKSMGERMVSAQRVFTQNDSVWFAHNLYKKVTANPKLKLRESDVKDALVGFRQALRDLGALQDDNKS